MPSLLLRRIATALCLLLLPSLAAAQEERVATWNLEWFFDADTSDNQPAAAGNSGFENSAPSQEEFLDRVGEFATAISEIEPAILGLEEVENEKVVRAIADELRAHHSLDYKVVFKQGNDTFTGQDVAFLVRADLKVIDFGRFDFSPFRDDFDFKDLSKHLFLTLELGGEKVTLIAVHLLASDGTGRIRQARTLRGWTEALVPLNNLIILGDFNTHQRFSETLPDSEMGIIRGFGSAATTDDLFDTHAQAAPRVTHVSGSELDRILLSPSLINGSGLDFDRVEIRRQLAILGPEDNGGGVKYSLPRELQDRSDHFPVVATFKVPTGTSPSPVMSATGPDRAAVLARLTQLEEMARDLMAEISRLREDLARP